MRRTVLRVPEHHCGTSAQCPTQRSQTPVGLSRVCSQMKTLQFKTNHMVRLYRSAWRVGVKATTIPIIVIFSCLCVGLILSHESDIKR